MNRTRKGLIAVGLLAALCSTAAWAAGNWSTLPIVGGASFCASTVSGTGTLGGITGQGQGTTGSICGETVPAGPTSITGNETVPADTNLTGGASPQTVRLTMASLNALPYTYYLKTGSSTIGTITVSPNQGMLILDYSGTLAAATVTLPPSAIDGQQFRLTSTQTVTSLTMAAASGDSLANGASPTALTVSTTAPYGYAWVYRLANTTWYRFQ